MLTIEDGVHHAYREVFLIDAQYALHHLYFFFQHPIIRNGVSNGFLNVILCSYFVAEQFDSAISSF